MVLTLKTACNKVVSFTHSRTVVTVSGDVQSCRLTCHRSWPVSPHPWWCSSSGTWTCRNRTQRPRPASDTRSRCSTSRNCPRSPSRMRPGSELWEEEIQGHLKAPLEGQCCRFIDDEVNINKTMKLSRFQWLNHFPRVICPNIANASIHEIVYLICILKRKLAYYVHGFAVTNMGSNITNEISYVKARNGS